MKDADPFDIFDSWFGEAQKSEPNDANAMAIATVAADARPSARMVLLKGHGRDMEPQVTGGRGGFVFYTNLDSRKGGELADNSNVALLFHWKSLRRQIRIEGPAHKVCDATADAYFASRPRASQIGAWASDQSRPLADRAAFAARYQETDEKYAEQDIPRPPHWSGHIVTPDRFEFWQDREFRLHERWVFERAANGTDSGWTTGMLYP